MRVPSPCGRTRVADAMTGTSDPRLVSVALDGTIAAGSVEEEQDRHAAVRDLIEENRFAPAGHSGGPYALRLSLSGRLLAFAIEEDAAEGRSEVAMHMLSLTPFARIIRDYDLIRESYYAAVRTKQTHEIEAIDMGRRGVHNEGSQLLMDRLAGKIEIDFDTARRLFTLVCALGDAALGRGPRL